MKLVMYSDVKVNIKKGCLTLPPNPVMRKGSPSYVDFMKKSEYNDLNKMRKLNLLEENRNCFELTKELKSWLEEPSCNFEIYQVFQGDTLMSVYLNKIIK